MATVTAPVDSVLADERYRIEMTEAELAEVRAKLENAYGFKAQGKRAAMDAAAVVLAGAAIIAIAKSGDLKGELRMHLMMKLLGKKKDKEASLLSAKGAQGVLSKTMQNTNPLSLGLAVTDAAKSGHSMMDRAKKLAEEIKENPHAALKLLLEDDATVRGTVERLDIEALRDAQKVLKTAIGSLMSRMPSSKIFLESWMMLRQMVRNPSERNKPNPPSNRCYRMAPPSAIFCRRTLPQPKPAADSDL
jgi:hypothetical protein